MRWYTQLALIGMLGAGGYAVHQNWGVIEAQLPDGLRATLAPLLGRPAGPQVAGAPGAQTPAGPGGGPAAGAAAGSGPRSPGAGGPGGPGQPPLVDVATIGTARIVERAEAVGTTRALESISVSSKISGIVERIAFDEGVMVAAGQELLRLDGAERRADVDAAKAQIAQEEARRNELRTRLERAIQLRRSGAGTEALVDDLTAQIRTADSAIQNAIARERAAQARLNDVVVRAPFAGRVGIRQVSVGSFIESRNVITTLDDISRIRLDFQVPETLMGRLQIGAAVSTTAPAFVDKVFKGEVAVIDTRVDPVTRSVRLTAIVDNPEALLRPGMFMNVSLTIGDRPDAIVVPEESIVGEGPLQVAFIVGAQNRIERRVLRTGQRDVGRVEVLEGVRVGETIVVRGVQRVRAGIAVTPRPIGAPQGAPGGGSPPAASAARPQAAAPPTVQTR